MNASDSLGWIMKMKNSEVGERERGERREALIKKWEGEDSGKVEDLWFAIPRKIV